MAKPATGSKSLSAGMVVGSLLPIILIKDVRPFVPLSDRQDDFEGLMKYKMR